MNDVCKDDRCKIGGDLALILWWLTYGTPKSVGKSVDCMLCGKGGKGRYKTEPFKVHEISSAILKMTSDVQNRYRRPTNNQNIFDGMYIII